MVALQGLGEQAVPKLLVTTGTLDATISEANAADVSP